ncbi:MAG: DUF2231 domain-containing protein [Acidimicrobiales bacterium]|nr:DUF2231 domain-containing protein [Acidimicrobiales bacterium]
MPPEPADPEASSSPAGGGDAVAARRRAAKAPTSPAAGRAGQPLHPLVVTVPIGAWVISFAFDLAARTANEELVYARGAFWLIGVGVVGGVAAAATGLLDLLAIPRGTRAHRTGLVHLGLSTFALAAFTVSFLLRRGADSLQAATAPMLALSVVALSALAVSAWLGVRLAFRYGVRVVDEAAQDEGYLLTGDGPDASAEAGPDDTGTHDTTTADDDDDDTDAEVTA